jgi:hypothetical protein
MDKFDWSKYDGTSQSTNEPKKDIEFSEKKFDWGKFETAEGQEELDQQRIEKEKSNDKMYQHFKAEEKTPEEISKMSVREKLQYGESLNREFDYLERAGFSKNFIKTASLGMSQGIEGLKPKEYELNQGYGAFMGGGAVIAATAALVSSGAGLLGITNAYLTGGITGGIYGTAKQAGDVFVEGKPFEMEEVAKEAGLFMMFHGLFEHGAKYGGQAVKWLKSFSPKQQSEALLEGKLPVDQTPTQYKLWQDEVVPELIKIAEDEYAEATQTAQKILDESFQNKMTEARTGHERKLYELSQKQTNQDEAAKALMKEYEEEVAQATKEYESVIKDVNRNNETALKEFEEAKIAHENQVKKDELVKNALDQPRESDYDLKGRVKPDGKDIGFKPDPPYTKDASLSDEVGSVVSKNKIDNPYEAGNSQSKIVMSSADSDYQIVKGLYKESDALQANISSEQPQLVQELNFLKQEIEKIPFPSTVNARKLNAVKNILDVLLEKIGTTGEEAIYAFAPVENKILLDQAKDLRQALSYDFTLGDSKKIIMPVIEALENAAERAAIEQGNTAAVEASKKSRAAYREWSQTYNNDYINPYRDLSNKSYIQKFDNSLNVDNYIQLDNVLNKTYEGQQLSQATRRKLVNDKLQKFTENPKNALTESFDETLNELKPILKEGEEQAIRQKFIQARKKPYIPAKKAERVVEPKEPDFKAQPKFKEPKEPTKPKGVEKITHVKVPIKGELEPSKEMIAISKKMKITPEKAMESMDSVTGIKNLRNELSKTEPGQKLMARVEKEKMKDLFYKGKVKPQFKGNEIRDILNEGSNFDVVSELIGEDAAIDMLNSAQKIGNNAYTLSTLKDLATKASTLKLLISFGIL